MEYNRITQATLLSFFALLSVTSAQEVLKTRADYGDIYGIVISMNGSPTNSRGISWYSTDRLVDSNVLVRESGTSWDEAQLFSGERGTHNFQVDNSLVRKDFYIHKVIVGSLNPGTNYEYKVGSDALNTWSDVGTFKTDALDSNNVSFMVTTDVHYGASEKVGYRYYDNAIESAYANDPDLDFLVMTGDLVNQWSDELYTYVYKEEEWIDAYTGNTYLPYTTFVHSAGNHDINERNDDFSYSIFNHYAIAPAPGLETKHGVTYSYDYGNAHFVVWNNPDTDYVYPQNQLDWLAADLAATTKDWKFLFAHVPLYEGQLNYTDELIQILEANDVDIVFTGHRHYYMRTKPMKNKVPTSMVTINESAGHVQKIYTLENEGVVHVTNSSTGGASAWRIHNGAVSSNVASNFGLNSVLPGVGTVQHGNGMYSLVTVNDNELTVDVYFRTTTSPEAPFNLLESYGNRKDYYKSLNRAIEAITPNEELTYADLEYLLALSQNLNKYENAFPELAALVTDDNKAKLAGAIDYILNPPPVVTDPPVSPSTNTGLYIGLGVGTLFIAVAAVYFIKFSKKRRLMS